MKNPIVADRKGVVKGKFVRVVVGEKFATVVSGGRTNLTFQRGTRGYAKAKQWATKRLK